MFRRWGITFRLVLYTLLSSSLVLIAVLSYDYYVSRQYISKNIDKELNLYSDLVVDKIEETLQSIEHVPEVLATFLSASSFSEQYINNVLRRIVEGSDRIFTAGVLYAPYSYSPKQRVFAPYCYTSEDSVECGNLNTKEYDYTKSEWYQEAMEKGKPLWSEPYLDHSGSGIIVSTYAVPFYRIKNGKSVFHGVVCTDISMKWLQSTVSKLGFGEKGFSFFIGKDGNLITHPEYEDLSKENVLGIAREKENERLEEALSRINRGEKGRVYYRSRESDDQRLLIYSPLPSSSWSVGIDFSKDKIISDLVEFDEFIILISAVGLFILFIVIYLTSRSITRSLRELDKKTRELAMGNLDFKPPRITSDDEVGRLARSFVFMRDSLKQRMAELTETTVIKERMLNELIIARRIQSAMLPKMKTKFATDPRFDLAFMLKPAREVAGDFYDFYYVDENHLFVSIGDVVGKGVPASLLMSMSRTLIKAMAKGKSAPVQILDRLNKEIYSNYEDGVFVTVFCGCLDLETGLFKFVNAGHNPPLIIQNEDGVSFLEVHNGTAAGVIFDPEYREETISLSKNSAILLYTDGATEIFNAAGDMFGEERFIEEISKVKKLGGFSMIGNIMKKLRAFSGKSEQDDDITLMFLRYLPEKKDISLERYRDTLTLKNDLSELTKIAEFVRTVSKKMNLDRRILYNLNLSLEELFTNTISYGFAKNSEHEIHIEVRQEGDLLVVKMNDDGRPFNPLKRPEPPSHTSVSEIPAHGFGLLIVRAFADNLEYEYSDGRNILTMIKNLDD